jgi:hypothetical protein
MDQRVQDKKIDMLYQIMDKLQQDTLEIKNKQNEVAQRQLEYTIPKLTKIEHSLYGNDKTGLLHEHIICQEKINILSKVGGKFTGIIFSLIFIFISFATGYAILQFKVNHIWRLLNK